MKNNHLVAFSSVAFNKFSSTSAVLNGWCDRRYSGAAGGELAHCAMVTHRLPHSYYRGQYSSLTEVRWSSGAVDW